MSSVSIFIIVFTITCVVCTVIFDESLRYKSKPIDLRYSHNVSRSNGRANIFNEVGECKLWSAEDRIDGGRQADIGELPCIALLEYLVNDNTYSFDCTGSLINHRYVITAAQCLHNKRLINVRLGEYDLSQNPDRDEEGEELPDCINVGIEEITIHPGYLTTDKARDDIGLIRLSMDVPYEVYFVQPICIPDETVSVAVGEMAKVAGWGSDGEEIKTRFLRSVWVEISDSQKCENIYGKGVMIYSTELCAGGHRNRSACVEDVGGPLLMRHNRRSYLIGIVSRSSGCLRDGVPDIYTRVSSYYKWIQANLKP